MNPARHPKSAGGLSNLIIHAERGKGRSPARRQSDDLRAVLTPCEMLTPTVTSRIEKLDEAFSERVARLLHLALGLTHHNFSDERSCGIF